MGNIKLICIFMSLEKYKESGIEYATKAIQYDNDNNFNDAL